MKKSLWILGGVLMLALYVGWGIYVALKWGSGQVAQVGAFGDSFAFVAGLLNGFAVLAAIYGTALQREDLRHSIEALQDQAIAQRDASRRALDANIVASQRMIVELAELGANLSEDHVDRVMALLTAAQMVKPTRVERGMDIQRKKQQDRGAVMQFIAGELRRASHRRVELEAERAGQPEKRS